jgi:hypothetical protein
MSQLSKLRRLFSGPAGDHREEIARLLIAAREDEAFGQRVRFLLRLPGPQRTSLVNTALHEMTLRGEPQSLREAFAVLATDTGAAAALRALDSA